MDLRQTKIETERLILVPVTSKHIEPIFREYCEPVTIYMNHGPVENLEILQTKIARRELEHQQGLSLFMVVLLKDSMEFLGCFALEDLHEASPEMGGWIKVSAHGKHYGREAAAGLKLWADQNVAYDQILWPCATMNIPSRKLAESLGGKIQKEYDKTTAQGKILPYVDYAIPKK